MILTAAPKARELACVILAGACLGLLAGGLGPLLSLTMARHGFPATTIGLTAAAEAFGGALAALAAMRLFRRCDAANALAIVGIGAGAITLLYPLAPPSMWWMAARALQGALMGFGFIAADLWFAARAPAAKRGRLMGVYSAFIALGFAGGPVLVAAIGLEGYAASMTLAMAGVLVSLAAKASGSARPPKREEEDTISLFGALRDAPAAALIIVAAAAVGMIALTLVPLHILRLNLDPATASRVPSLYILAAAVATPLLGRLIDAVNPLVVARWAGLAGIVCAGTMLVFADVLGVLIGTLIALGVCAGSFYVAGFAHIAERFPIHAGLPAAAIALNLADASGGTLGPWLGGFAMDALGLYGLPLTFVVAMLLPLIASFANARPTQP